MKNKLLKIESKKNKKGLLNITRGVNGKFSLEDRPPKRSSGLYWIYTNYSMEEICNSIKSFKSNAVDIPLLFKQRRNLRNVIKPTENGEFWIVYNGIGGWKKDSKHSYDLGERIFKSLGTI